MKSTVASWTSAIVLASPFNISAWGAVLHVPAGYPTIQAAVNAAVDGDTVIVAPGRYNQRVSIENKSLTLTAEEGADGGEGVILDGRDLTMTMLSVVGAGTCIVQGFRLQNCVHGAMLFGCDGAVRHCVFNGNSTESLFAWYGSALSVSGTTQVSDCAFIGNDGGAVQVAGAPMFIRCDFERNSARAVSIWNSSPSFTDCRFIDNHSVGDGGAIYCSNSIEWSEPMFDRCEFRGNVAGSRSSPADGGVMWGFNACRPTFVDCRFERNRAANGGVLANMGPTETFIDCTFIANSAYWGGVLCRQSGSTTHVERCLFENNTAEVAGAISLNHAASGGEPSIIDSVFRGNAADTAGAIALKFGTLTIANCVFDGNASTHQGGAMLVYNASARIVNCTFARNTAGDAWKGAPASGAIHLHFHATATIDNSICWHNSPRQIVLEYKSEALINHSLIEGGWSGGAGNLDADPKFGDLASGDVRLRRDSPAIDAGDNDRVPASVVTDIDGLARITDGDADGEACVDLGAHEFPAACPADIFGHDGLVNANDLFAVITSWGPCGDCGSCPADIAPSKPDCNVNVADLLAVISHWGACP